MSSSPLDPTITENISMNIEEMPPTNVEELSNAEIPPTNVDELSNTEIPPTNVEELSNTETPPTNVEETPLQEESPINPLALQTFESIPDPIVELMKQHTRIALLIGLNYTESSATLQNRIQCVNNAKQILISDYDYTEENIIVLTEPSREQTLSTLNNVIGSSALVTQIIIYYAGYGNGINQDLTKESGIIDNFKKVIVPADFTQIDITQLLLQSCCKTLCIMDICPYKDDEMPLKWSAEITNHVKAVTFCESDSYNSNKNKLFKQMIAELAIS